MSLRSRWSGALGQFILIALVIIVVARQSVGQQPTAVRGVREQDQAARRTSQALNLDARAEARAQASAGIADSPPPPAGAATPSMPFPGAPRAAQPNIQQAAALHTNDAGLRAADLGIWLSSSPVAHDLTITAVAPNSPLAAAGFREQDGIVSLNGTPLRSEAQLVRSLLAPSSAESGANVVILRDGQRQTLTVSPALVRQGIVAGDPLYQAGMVVDSNNSNQIVVQRVYPRTAAYYAGLQAGDVIRGLNGQQITSAASLSQLFQSGSGADLGLVVTRGGQDRQLALNLGGGSFAADGSVRTAQQPDAAQLNAGVFGANPSIQTNQSGPAGSGASLPNTSSPAVGSAAAGVVTPGVNPSSPGAAVVPGTLPPGRLNPTLPTNPGTAGVNAGGATSGIPGVATTPSGAVLNPSTGPQNFVSPPLGASPNPAGQRNLPATAPLGTTPGFNSLNANNNRPATATGNVGIAPNNSAGIRGAATPSGPAASSSNTGAAAGTGAAGSGAGGAGSGGAGAGGSGAGGGAAGGGSGGGAGGGGS